MCWPSQLRHSPIPNAGKPCVVRCTAALLSLLPRTSRTQYKQCMAKESDAAAAAAAAAIGGAANGAVSVAPAALKGLIKSTNLPVVALELSRPQLHEPAAAVGGTRTGRFGSTCGIERVDKLYELTGGGAGN